jgi:hypothetical protein
MSILDQMRRISELLDYAEVRLYVGRNVGAGESEVSVFLSDAVYPIRVTDDEWATGDAPEIITGMIQEQEKNRSGR